jgi:hypothetical protein
VSEASRKAHATYWNRVLSRWSARRGKTIMTR